MPNVQGRLDHSAVDLKGKRLFVAALGDNQNTVEVIDLKSGKRVASTGSKQNLRVSTLLISRNFCGQWNGRTCRFLMRVP